MQISKDERTPGIIVPSVAAQEQLIREIYKAADLDPSQTGYVEAHGTGTPVGDPLEVQAIVYALSKQPRETPLYVGSVKSVVGHLEGGARLAGLIYAALTVESKIIPPVAGLETLNPRIIQRKDLKKIRLSKDLNWDLMIWLSRHVLHATAELSVCLNNAKKLLKDGGDLIVIENVKPELMCSPLGFGLLPGWWRSVEPYRRFNPLIDEEQLHEELKNAGFHTRLTIKDTDDKVYEMSAFVATRVPSSLSTKRLCSIIYSSVYNGQYELARLIAGKMSTTECTCALVDLNDVSPNHINAIGIVLLGYRGLDLSALSESEFKKLQ
ncbi:polyketide synthase [Aspergillus affinis]|uniref:polyketide synthase n=1 Tax=Aspergillus affinis TaxID=1070780 RepID=UPI0022FE9E41|nr:polyketide synthase [Aspergillus affinis]KAI9040576.1 polyketide synthase [Aspergillus affinis]